MFINCIFLINIFLLFQNIISISLQSHSNLISSLKCLPKPKLEEAFEIISPLNCSVYIADNQQMKLSRQDYISWNPSNLWMKNPGGIRFLTFDDSCLFASPGNSKILKEKMNVAEPWNQVDWVYLANGCVGEYGLGGCFPEPCKFLLPNNGSLKWNEISKCHYMKWNANKPITILTSPEGDQFLLHATPTYESASSGKIYGNPLYPPGWSITTHILENDFLLTPNPNDSTLSSIPNSKIPFGQFSCGYVVINDAVGNSFHRITNISGIPSTLREDAFGKVILFMVFFQYKYEVLYSSLIIILLSFIYFLSLKFKKVEKNKKVL